ncbi:MAG: hypothetical protein QOH39_1563 [Verrucomicrobiota bacterium]|jgi:hypothetical protein
MGNGDKVGMKKLIQSVFCLSVMMCQAANGQGGSANNTPAQTAVAAPVPAPRYHPARRQRGDARNQSLAPRMRAARSNGKPARQPAINYTDALRRHRHERHDRAWWKSHYAIIVFATSGYYYWDAGYWFPAWGYDSTYGTYDSDGPIYCYGNLLPDQVIYNVQRALQQLGYYSGGLTGSLGPSTRAALAAYQEDAGLEITGAIDAPTVESLGLE